MIILPATGYENVLRTAVAAGETRYRADGVFDNLAFSDLAFPAGSEIDARGAHFVNAEITRVSNLTIRGGAWEGRQKDLKVSPEKRSCKALDLVDCTNVQIADGEAYGSGVAIYLRGGRDLTVDGMLVKPNGFVNGIQGAGVDGYTLTRNTLLGLIADGVHVGSSRRGRIADNRILGRWMWPGLTGVHSDGIQIEGPSDGCEIARNIIAKLGNGIMASASVSQPGNPTNLHCNDNYVMAGSGNGIAMHGYTGCTSSGDYVATYPGAPAQSQITGVSAFLKPSYQEAYKGMPDKTFPATTK